MSSKSDKFADAFTMVELLVALAITAVLLAAVAVAFNASIINYRENEDIFKAINSARQALTRTTNQLRTAYAVDPNAPANECTLLIGNPPDINSITYKYDPTDNKLYLITNDDLTDDDYLLCDNVAAMTFTKNTMIEDMQIEVKSVQISMTVVSGNIQKTLSAAVVIRRNLN
jgi:prepilin-type N-terminal cleavage/methylation domain-containing protein